MEIINQMELSFLSKAENIALARVTVASFAAQLDFTLNEIEEIKVAVSEAVSNAVIHGYAGRTGLVRVEAKLLRPARLEVSIEDQGQGIEDVAKAREPAFSTLPDRMGLGFVFIESFMDELEVSSRPGEGTRLRMVKIPLQSPEE